MHGLGLAELAPQAGFLTREGLRVARSKSLDGSRVVDRSSV